jgi:hypothetical protein
MAPRRARACGVRTFAAGGGVSRALSVPRRSAPVVILLAVGLFLTVGILAMRHDPAAGCEHPWSAAAASARSSRRPWRVTARAVWNWRAK